MNKTTTDTSVEEGQADAAKRREIGEFVRGVSGFRNVVGSFEFPSEAGRYHLFVALNCPWCHRVTLARNLLGLQSSISLEVAFPSRTDEDDPVGPNLWEFNPTRITTLTGTSLPECMPETATGAGHRLVKQIYAAQGSGEGSVPVLYDKKTKRIVNNESAEIIRTLNDQADALGSSISTADRPNLYPDDHIVRDEINALNEAIYVSINNGAHKTGFSSDQTVYAAAFKTYFDMLGAIEARLASDDRLFIAGDKFTEADLRLFPTLYRHDPVYYVRMKLNGARILDYPHLWRWLCRVYALPDVAASSSLIHCREGYFGRSWNNVIPLGPIKPTTYPEAYKHSE
jgi:putative glutathione S-transferase